MDTIITDLRSIDADSFTTEEQRKQAVSEAHALVARLESPWETVVRLVLTLPPQMSCLKAALDMGLFRKWLRHNDGANATAKELSNLVECDNRLLERLLRLLAVTHMIRRDDGGHYQMTSFTASLIRDNLACSIEYLFSFGMDISLRLPDFFRETGYKNPDGIELDFFKHTQNKQVWEWLAADPVKAQHLDDFMKASCGKRGHFSDIYPADKLSCAEDDVLLVDIGGGLGHDLQAFKTKYPSVSGKLVLQDQEKVTARAESEGMLHPSIQVQRYDFFEPQPIKGAQAYFLHTILHDWNDFEAKRILENIRHAMKPGHSKVIIQEMIMSEERLDVEITSRDLVMLSFASGKERTMSQWEHLIQSAGLEINKIWHSTVHAESVIEAVVP